MSKELKSTVKEFVNSISESELLFVVTRLTDRFAGDLADTLEFMSKHKGMDHLLGSARSSDEFYAIFDQITEVIKQECDKKGLFNAVA